jgi:putative chitinase
MSFEFDFTPEKLAHCIKNPHIAEWYDPICEILPEYQINNPRRVASWLSQCGHESADFKFMQENLNYGAKGLRGVFPKYFPTDDMANAYQRQPEKIANRVYGNRMGNGPEETGEGYMYRGRGIIQITGKDNYRRCSIALYGDESLLENPDWLCEIDGAIRSACWYWNSRNLNADADREDVLALTKKINGGTHGLDDRMARYGHCISILGQ